MKGVLWSLEKSLLCVGGMLELIVCVGMLSEDFLVLGFCVAALWFSKFEWGPGETKRLGMN